MVKWKSATHKRIFYAWGYGSGFIGLAKRYGWRRVRETQRIIFNGNKVHKA